MQLAYGGTRVRCNSRPWLESCFCSLNMKTSPIAYHCVLRSEFPSRPFVHRRDCVQVWRLLQRYFPQTIAAVLMPNHFHLLVWPLDLDQVRFRMGMIRRDLRRLYPGIVWETISDPKPLPDRFHLLREIRYVHLNPCRKQLCVDPIEWEWSTHREYLNAVARPWIDPPKVIQKLGRPWTGWPADELRRRMHLYISGDPSVHPMGTAAPMGLSDVGWIDISRVKLTGVLALRCTESELLRKGRLRARLVRVLARGSGVVAPKIAAVFGVDRRSVSEIGRRPWKTEDEELLRSLRVIQSDPRFFGPGSIQRLDRF